MDITHVTALDGTPHAVSQGGAAVRLGNTRYTGQVNIRGLFAWPHTLETPPSSAICMKHVDVASVSDTLLIGHMKDVLLQPGKGQFTALVQMTNSCLDTAQSGMGVEPVDGGRVLRCGFSNIWFGAHTGDGMVVNGTDGAVPGLQFTNCMFMGNGENGVRASGVGVDGLYFSNCFASANARNGLFWEEEVKGSFGMAVCWVPRMRLDRTWNTGTGQRRHAPERSCWWIWSGMAWEQAETKKGLWSCWPPGRRTPRTGCERMEIA